tara:strand:+ start:231 stop:599 length:369 start_codon:yes stop_codon:yes gene_type:complete
MAKFPHEFSMKRYNLIETDLNDDATEALEEFENFLSHLTSLKQKAGEDWVMTKAQQKKINRLSRAVCTEIEFMVEEAFEPTPPKAKEQPKTPEKVEAKEEAPKPESKPSEESDSSIYEFFGI